jgi:hypothetical protein
MVDFPHLFPKLTSPFVSRPTDGTPIVPTNKNHQESQKMERQRKDMQDASSHQPINNGCFATMTSSAIFLQKICNPPALKQQIAVLNFKNTQLKSISSPSPDSWPAQARALTYNPQVT